MGQFQQPSWTGVAMHFARHCGQYWKQHGPALLRSFVGYQTASLPREVESLRAHLYSEYEDGIRQYFAEHPRGVGGQFEAPDDKILRIIFDAGRAMEGHPATYRGKDEEPLRDHFITVLRTHFSGTTGEISNKKGKSDILVRQGSLNALVAECKIWKGAKAFLAALDQLLGNLTWRDSRAVAILFVKNKELSTVLQVIERETPSHSCFGKFVARHEDGWFSFEFHFPGDPGQAIQLGVLVFHFPE